MKKKCKPYVFPRSIVKIRGDLLLTVTGDVEPFALEFRRIHERNKPCAHWRNNRNNRMVNYSGGVRIIKAYEYGWQITRPAIVWGGTKKGGMNKVNSIFGPFKVNEEAGQSSFVLLIFFLVKKAQLWNAMNIQGMRVKIKRDCIEEKQWVSESN